MRILIAVIAYNEEKNIERAIRDLKRNTNYDIVVIDNSSTDNTADICRKFDIQVLSHCVNTGGSMGTVKTYMQYAHEQNYDIVCQFDGDGQHCAKYLPDIIAPIRNGEADYVIGSRFLKKRGFQSYFFRRLGINLFSYLSSKIIGHKITDVTSGFRAYEQKVIKFFSVSYKHELFDTTQLLLLSHYMGARIKEVPVDMREREFGQSEYTVFKKIMFPIMNLIVIVGCFLQKNQIKKGRYS